MSFADSILRILAKLITHPVTQAAAQHAIRGASAELVRAIRRHRDTRKSGLHMR